MIYLDNAATSFPKAPGVAEAVASCIRSLPGSPGRASHAWAIAASEALFEAREKVAGFFGIAVSERLVFTKSATEALNLALKGFLSPASRVVVSPFEHNAVMRPLRFLEATGKLTITVFPCSPGASPDLAALAAILGSRPDLLVAQGASNVTGAALPIPEISRLARKAGVPLLVDASQLVGHRAVDISALGADLVAFSGHKGLMGPTGTGCLYVAPGIDLVPLVHGGTGSASESEVQPTFLPDRFEAGTQNLPALVGLRAAIDFLESQGMAAIEAREKSLRTRLAKGLRAMDGLSILSCDDEEEALPLVSAIATMDGIDESDIAEGLDARGIAIRMGLHCAPAAHRRVGSFARGGSLRFSPGFFTTEGEIDEALAALKEILA